MPIFVWSLLIFAVWTILVLSGSVGIYRWSRVLTGRADIKDWLADEVQGNEWYRRAMRAHLNCIENLPVFTATVVAVWISDIRSPVIDVLAIIISGARIAQTLVHIALVQSNTIASLRFALFFCQAVSMLIIVALVTIHSLG